MTNGLCLFGFNPKKGGCPVKRVIWWIQFLGEKPFPNLCMIAVFYVDCF
ncbi:hypothetical protein Z948_3548 [Sulfitobacter donghicola DSW-25 = KCTC 12864 = JCM 14565]|nr:hypothetical protein Z948_3548 [Sulfitobacter donghicola DSW-25 = KCTC 12864 = JCM 14565]